MGFSELLDQSEKPFLTDVLQTLVPELVCAKYVDISMII